MKKIIDSVLIGFIVGLAALTIAGIMWLLVTTSSFFINWFLLEILNFNKNTAVGISIFVGAFFSAVFIVSAMVYFEPKK